MTSRDPGHRAHRFLAILALVTLASQAGCEGRAPATEPERRLEAQEKRRASLVGESARPSAKVIRPSGRR